MSASTIIQHLFKTEYSKIVAVLTNSFGLDHLDLAEDVVNETFLTALNIWPYQKLPPNPTAWLYTVAKNKLKNHIIQRNKISKNKPEPSVSEDPFEQIEIDFSEQHIVDSQLRMLLVICDPCISNEMQICLALRILGGLGLDEIADAFLTNKETIHKRLQRAKEKLREKKISFELPPAKNISKRLDAVLQTIYLLFSEGYYSERHNHIVRKELCIEALNLAYLLLQNPVTDLHDTNALMALMCFQSSRLEARKSLEYPLMLFDHQDINLWDQEFIEKGNFYLQQASKWPTLSPYYLEASIAYWHTVKNEYPEKWLNILNLYDHLLLIQNSPVAALNRLWAYSKVNGTESAIREADKIVFKTTHFYSMLMAHLYRGTDLKKTKEYLSLAYQQCKTDTERTLINKFISTLSDQITG